MVDGWLDFESLRLRGPRRSRHGAILKIHKMRVSWSMDDLILNPFVFEGLDRAVMVLFWKYIKWGWHGQWMTVFWIPMFSKIWNEPTFWCPSQQFFTHVQTDCTHKRIKCLAQGYNTATSPTCDILHYHTVKVSKVAKIRNRYNQVPHLTQDTNGKVTNSQKTPQTRAKRSALSQQVTTKHI